MAEKSIKNPLTTETYLAKDSSKPIRDAGLASHVPTYSTKSIKNSLFWRFHWTSMHGAGNRVQERTQQFKLVHSTHIAINNSIIPPRTRTRTCHVRRATYPAVSHEIGLVTIHHANRYRRILRCERGGLQSATVTVLSISISKIQNGKCHQFVQS